ncbi:MAG: NADH-quinone oxidoreductase subunit B family protein [Dehalococcoidia bacterium]|nr:NADH-quinone oxidoreductase subunit B family protein [Dehalococcoidia bacterium]
MGSEKPAVPYSSVDLDWAEGHTIESLKAESTQPIPDPVAWIDEEIKRNVLVSSVDYVIDWARRSSMFPAGFGLACCAMEMVATGTARFDLSRFGMEVFRASPRQADLMIVSGTVTWKMAPSVKLIYEQMAEPKWVLAMGSCAISGGTFREYYSVVPGVNRIIPVDIYVPGCPPRPDALLDGIIKLHHKVSKISIAKRH